MRLINGRMGFAHVTGLDDAALNRGIVGSADYIINGVLTLAAIGPNNYQLSRCDIVQDGVHSRIEGSETVSFEAGDLGMYRMDTVVAYYQQNVDGTEESGIKVLTGTPSVSQIGAAPPAVDSTSIYGGASYHETRLFDVLIYEYDVQTITSRCLYLPTLEQLKSCKEYEVGDTAIFTKYVTNGYISTGKSVFRFNICLGKGISQNVNKVTASTVTGMARQAGKYIVGDGSKTGTLPIDVIHICPDRHNIRVSVNTSSVIGNITNNNDTASIDINRLVLTFE